MPAPLLLDLTHTAHTRARTGVQRVARSLHTHLGDRATPITHDPYQNTWRSLAPWEHQTLSETAASGRRGAHWPLLARVGGRLRRAIGRTAVLPSNSGVLVPEIFSAAVGGALPSLFAHVTGPRIAVFHDAIALQFPELTPAKTVARFPAYLVELTRFDAIAAVSDDSRSALVDYWRWLGLNRIPHVRTMPLGIDAAYARAPGGTAPVGEPPVILCVGSIEGRKNHLALLEACESLWAAGEVFTLHLIGLPQPQTGAAALARLQALQSAGRPLRYDGPVSDAALEDAYARCAFTIYPSLIEGFGLPVLESLAHGRPCICSARGALGESARGGGCLALDRVDATSLANALRRVLRTPTELAALTAAARARKFRTWSDFASDVLTWADELRRT
jgi:glycosyltransferase involved in cell wall biosynthesis